MYKLDFTDEGKTSLALQDKKIAQRILNKLKWLIQNVTDIIPLSLEGKFDDLVKSRHTGENRCPVLS